LNSDTNLTAIYRVWAGTICHIFSIIKSLDKSYPAFLSGYGQPLTAAEAKVQRRAQISAEALDIFQAPTRVLAEQRLDTFVEKWQPLEPRAVKNFLWGIKRCFEFYAFDAALHSLIRSTNLLERFFREFRAKSDEIGSFPNAISCLTIFYLVMARDQAKHDRLNFAKT